MLPKRVSGLRGRRYGSLPYVRELKPTLLSSSYYSDNVFHGNEKDLCLPCPGLFGLGVYESSTQLMTAAEATEFWWTRPQPPLPKPPMRLAPVISTTTKAPFNSVATATILECA